MMSYGRQLEFVAAIEEMMPSLSQLGQMETGEEMDAEGLDTEYYRCKNKQMSSPTPVQTGYDDQ